MSSDTIGNRTRDLPACSAVPQPNAQPRPREQQVDTVTALAGGFKTACWFKRQKSHFIYGITKCYTGETCVKDR
jgi:hypothetical protein